MPVDLNQLSRSTRDRALAALDAYNHAADLVRELKDDGILVLIGQTRSQGWEIVQVSLLDPETQAKRPERRPPNPPAEEDEG